MVRMGRVPLARVVLGYLRGINATANPVRSLSSLTASRFANSKISRGLQATAWLPWTSAAMRFLCSL